MYKVIFYHGSNFRQFKKFATIRDALKFTLTLRAFELHELYKIEK